MTKHNKMIEFILFWYIYVRISVVSSFFHRTGNKRSQLEVIIETRNKSVMVTAGESQLPALVHFGLELGQGP